MVRLSSAFSRSSVPSLFAPSLLLRSLSSVSPFLPFPFPLLQTLHDFISDPLSPCTGIVSALDKAEDPPLYRIVYADGDEEDMDRTEFEAAFVLAAQQKKGHKKIMKEERNPTQKNNPQAANWDGGGKVAVKEEQNQTTSANAEKKSLKAAPVNDVHAEIISKLSQVRYTET